MKAILVIDIPKEFENREPYYVEGTLFCHIDDYYTKYRYVCSIGKTKLKTMPQKKNIEISLDSMDDWLKHSERLGYNKCINEILGGNNE